MSLPQGWVSTSGRWASGSGGWASVSCFLTGKLKNTGVMLNFQIGFSKDKPSKSNPSRGGEVPTLASPESP